MKSSRQWVGVALAAITVGAAAASLAGEAPGSPLPAWLYPVEPPRAGPVAAPGGAPAAPAAEVPMRTVPGSTVSIAANQIGNPFGPADWFPGQHPAMPEVVAHGRRPDVWACSLCHLPSGVGRPESAPMAGASAQYLVAEMENYRNGVRASADPGSSARMIAIAKAMTDEEIHAAADYFAQTPFRPVVRVVETDTVPHFRSNNRMLVPAEDGGTEPLAGRLIEMPENMQRTTLRDPNSGFVAYVPVGSLKRGEMLVKTGGGITTACGGCHGADLKGKGIFPPIAGRSPSYLLRQLYDTKVGVRHGPRDEMMKPLMAKLELSDMVAIAAYSASLAP